jgi:hypothetical protein
LLRSTDVLAGASRVRPAACPCTLRTVESSTDHGSCLNKNCWNTSAQEYHMQRYKNLSGESGVIAYDIGDRSITIRFTGGDRYLYTDQSAGAENIAEMQRLATLGSGLSTFISQVVKERYERKLD